MTDNLTEQTIANIVQTWKGGERRLAGRRASELAFGNSKTPDAKLVERLENECPGIGQFISAPEVPINYVADNQPEYQRQAEAEGPSNTSPNSSKADQNRIDAKLAAGQKRSANAPDDMDLTGSTKLNPDEGPASAPKGKPGK